MCMCQLSPSPLASVNVIACRCDVSQHDSIVAFPWPFFLSDVMGKIWVIILPNMRRNMLAVVWMGL